MITGIFPCIVVQRYVRTAINSGNGVNMVKNNLKIKYPKHEYTYNKHQAIILERLEFIKERIIAIERHLEKINGNVGKHEAFINQQKVLNWIVMFIMTAFLGTVIKLAFL